MTQSTLGTRILRLRTQRGITQAELAEALGVTDRAVSKWETGIGYPDFALLIPLADFFAISLDDLLRGKSRTVQTFFADYTNTRFQDTVNSYLKEGWRIADFKLTGTQDSAFGAILFEKEDFEENES